MQSHEYHQLVKSRDTIRRKKFLKRIYETWYREIVASLPAIDGPVMEIGSGGGFLGEHIPDLITTDFVPTPLIRCAASAEALPFESNSLRAVVMINVLHHLPDPQRFFAEAERCLKTGGSILLVEPWVSSWSRFVYSFLHHEPFATGVQSWKSCIGGPLSGANSAMPWIIVERDRELFRKKFPSLDIDAIKPCMPFLYLLSCGMYPFSLAAGGHFAFWQRIEYLLARFMNFWAMFAYVKITRRL